MLRDKLRELRDPIQCCGCGKGHFLKNHPHQNGSKKNFHNIQQDETGLSDKDHP